MQLRACGKSGLELPVLGIGCWAFGGGDYWGARDQGEVDEVVGYAVDHGGNFFETAEAYNQGASETALGLALQGRPRDRVIIATKISPAHVAPRELVAHCEASLRRLRTDYLDLYLVHWPITAHAIRHFTSEPGPTPSPTEAFATLDGLRRAGKIRHIGVSNFGREKLSEALATGVPIAVNALPYSLLARAIETEILPFCRAQGVGVLGYMPLMQGVLADLYPTLADVPVWQRRTRHFASSRTPLCRHGLVGAEAETTAALEAIRALAGRLGMTMPELALKWVFAGEGITSSLCGARTVAKLRANLQAAEAPLDPAVVAALDDITRPLLEKLGPSFDFYENAANDRTK